MRVLSIDGCFVGVTISAFLNGERGERVPPYLRVARDSHGWMTRNRDYLSRVPILKIKAFHVSPIADLNIHFNIYHEVDQPTQNTFLGSK